MKRVVLLGLLLAALAVAVISTPPTAQAFVYCKCGLATNTPTLSAWANTCPQALASLESQLVGYMNCADCREPVLHATCSSTGGEDPVATATGYYTYRCYQTGGGCSIP